MGSLMAGWQTNPMDAKEAFKRSTSSVTREEVERFWKAKKELIEKQQTDANQARSIVVPTSPGSESGCESGSSRAGSNFGSPPVTPTSPSLTSSMQDAGNIRSPGWWQKSYWAFLNEPPVLENRQNRYVAQYNPRAAPVELDLDAPEISEIQLRHTASSLT